MASMTSTQFLIHVEMARVDDDRTFDLDARFDSAAQAFRAVEALRRAPGNYTFTYARMEVRDVTTGEAIDPKTVLVGQQLLHEGQTLRQVFASNDTVEYCVHADNQAHQWKVQGRFTMYGGRCFSKMDVHVIEGLVSSPDHHDSAAKRVKAQAVLVEWLKAEKDIDWVEFVA